VLDLPAPEVSPHAEMQPDRRTVMRRLALLYRLGHGHARPWWWRPRRRCFGA